MHLMSFLTYIIKQAAGRLRTDRVPLDGLHRPKTTLLHNCQVCDIFFNLNLNVTKTFFSSSMSRSRAADEFHYNCALVHHMTMPGLLRTVGKKEGLFTCRAKHVVPRILLGKKWMSLLSSEGWWHVYLLKRLNCRIKQWSKIATSVKFWAFSLSYHIHQQLYSVADVWI